MATYLELPETMVLANPRGKSWEVVFDPASADPSFATSRIVGLMPKRSRRRKPPKSDIVELLNAVKMHDREAVYVAMLDGKDRVIAVYVVSIGGPAMSIVDKTSLLRAVLLCDPAGGVVLVHNHPSGQVTPSPDDISLTRGVSEMLDIYGYFLADHIIIGREGVFSFWEAGLVAES